MQNLKVTLIQTELYWQNPEANRSMLEEKLWAASPDTDLILLPEMFTTGFTMEASQFAEPMNMHSFKWMKQMAAQTKAVIAGSLIIKDQGNYFNRLIWMRPDGSYEFYDKRHLFRMAEEHMTFTPGNERKIVELKGWKILPLVCYDLRFPVWSRNIRQEYDLLLYVANWPESRRSAWKTLLPARAIENLSFSIGLNRIGVDGKDLPYSGDTGVWNFKGENLIDLGNENKVYTIELNKNEQEEFRRKFPAHLDADEFFIKY